MLGGGPWGGLPPLRASPRLYVAPRNRFRASARIGVDGETTYETRETTEGNERLPLYDFRYFSRLSWENSILDIRVLLHCYFSHECVLFFKKRISSYGKSTILSVILARLLVVLLVILRQVLPIFRTFLGDYTTLHVAIRLTTCFFFRNRPPEESDNKRSSARRGEFDSSTPEAIGVSLG